MYNKGQYKVKDPVRVRNTAQTEFVQRKNLTFLFLRKEYLVKLRYLVNVSSILTFIII